MPSDAANHKTADQQRQKTEKPSGPEDFHSGRENEETVSLISETKLKCNENEDYNCNIESTNA